MQRTKFKSFLLFAIEMAVLSGFWWEKALGQPIKSHCSYKGQNGFWTSYYEWIYGLNFLIWFGN